MEEREVNTCRFCSNNRTNPEWNISEEQCSYAMYRGKSADGHRIMLVKNPNEPLMIETAVWNENLKTPEWQMTGYYYPKFCPECGREINEYDRTKFDQDK